jgi:hypothetical protein
MKFFLVCSLVGLYFCAFIVDVSSACVAFLALFILFLLFNLSKKQNCGFIAIILELMCYCIPISWRNIFGGSFATLPIPWFYILGAVLIVHLFFKKFYKKSIRGYGRALTSIGSLILIFLALVPLLMTKHEFFSESIGQFITLGFYNIILFFAIVKGPLMDNYETQRVRLAYMLSGFVTSIGIIIQFVFHRFTGVALGNIGYALNRVIYGFMFMDISNGTLYLVTTAFMMLLYADKYSRKKILFYMGTVFVLAAAAITSARTGIISFFLVFGIYILFNNKGLFSRIKGIITGSIILLVTFYFFNIVRPMDNVVSYMLNSSGRIQGYIIAFNIFLKNFFIGTGFGRSYTSLLMGGVSMPHFSVLQYLVQTGIVYTSIIFGVILYAQILAIKKHFIEGWLLLLTMVGSCFIPDIFSSRFIILIMLMIFLQQSGCKSNYLLK